MTLQIFETLTANGVIPATFDTEQWLKRSRQKGKRHPLSPEGICMTCGDHKLGYWQWVPFEPDEGVT